VHNQLSFYTWFEADCGEALFKGAHRNLRAISHEKITKILEKMKTRKTTEPDGIHADLLK
jgi:hypothetical protein